VFCTAPTARAAVTQARFARAYTAITGSVPRASELAARRDRQRAACAFAVTRVDWRCRFVFRLFQVGHRGRAPQALLNSPQIQVLARALSNSSDAHAQGSRARCTR
jgi:hypothetical protein